MKTRIKNKITSKLLSEIWNNDTFQAYWITAVEQLISEYSNLADKDTKYAIENSTFIKYYLAENILLNYGNLNIAFYTDDKFWTQVRIHCYEMASALLPTYNLILGLKPEELLDMSLQTTDSKSLIRGNDSQFQKAGMNIDDFANEFANAENTELNRITYGNQLAVLRRLIKTGVGIDVEYWTNRFRDLVVLNWGVEFADDDETIVINDMQYNKGENEDD